LVQPAKSPLRTTSLNGRSHHRALASRKIALVHSTACAMMTRRAGGDHPVVDGDGWRGRHVVGLGGLANCRL